jgi:cytidine deaminase
MERPELVLVRDLPEPWRELYDLALEARLNAHAPYSRFRVGAAVRCVTGRAYAGCNVENSSYGLTVCAERVAVWKAVSTGETALMALAVVTDVGATPCGACRQVLGEFAEDLPVLVADTEGRGWMLPLRQLLPHAYPYSSLSDLLSPQVDAREEAPDAPSST